MKISERSQIAIVWWSLAFATIFGASLAFLLHMVPPPSPTMPAEQVKAWYQQNSTDIEIGATIASYTSAFLVPLFVVIGMQIARQETGRPVWATMSIVGGSLSSIFLALPPIFFGAAAFSPDRNADATALMHELGVLTLITTAQYFTFAWIGLVVISLLPRTAEFSPFPRWYGYLNIWLIFMFELGALAFNFKAGPFSWRGLFCFYLPFGLFAVWIVTTAYLLLTALKRQRLEPATESPALAARA